MPTQVDDELEKYAAKPASDDDELEKYAHKASAGPQAGTLDDYLGKPFHESENRDSSERPGFVKRLGQSLSLPTSKEELQSAATPSVAESILGPIVPAAKGAYEWGKRAIKNIGEGGKEEHEAAKNIKEGGPVLPNIGKAAYGVVHGGVGSIPYIGEPIETAGQDVLEKNYPGAAGGLTGVAAQVLAPELTKKGGGAVREALPSKADIALKLRDQETGKIGPGTEALARLGGAALGHLSTYAGLPLVGELGGYAVGPRIAEAVIPKLPTDIPVRPGMGGATLPSIEDFYQNRAEDLTARGKEQGKIDIANEKRLADVEEARQKELADQEKLKEQEAQSRQRRGTEQERLDRAAARKAAENPLAGLQTTAQPVGNAILPAIGEGGTSTALPRPAIPGVTAPLGPVAKPTPPKIISPTEGEAVRTGNEGRPATWTKEYILEEAGKGNREAITQAVLRGLRLPENARYVMGDPDVSRAVLNPREVTRFTPEGEPIRNKENPFTKEPTARIPTIARTPRPGIIPAIPEAPTRVLPFPGPMPPSEPLPAANVVGERPATPAPKAAAGAPTLLEPIAPFGIKPLENAKPIMEPAPEAENVPRETTPAEPAKPARDKNETNAIRAELSEAKQKAKKWSDKVASARPSSWRAQREWMDNLEHYDRRAAELQDALDKGTPIKLGQRGATREELTVTYRNLKPEDKAEVDNLASFFSSMKDTYAKDNFAAQYQLNDKSLKGLPTKEKLARFITRDVKNSPAAKFIRSLGQNPEAETPAPEAQAAPEPTKPLIPNIGQGETGIIPGMEQDVAKQNEGAAKVAGEKLTGEINRPKDISAAAGRMETLSPLFRGTEASPQKEIFGGAPEKPATPQVPPTIEPVLKETGWEYGGRNALGLHTFQEPGTNVKIELWDREMNPDFIRRKIATKEKQFGGPKAKGKKTGGEEVPF